MAVKLFVLGLPGSGKSSVARFISIYARDRLWLTTRINDYAILYEMFQNEFEATEFGGFDVLDLTVFDIALKKLEQQVNRYSSTNPNEIILIEFSRNDYQKAFRQFSKEFLQGSYFLYLAADIETCKRRIRERFTHPTTSDDHFVSEYIFGAYYHKDNGQAIPQILERGYCIDKQRIEVIDNNGSLSESIARINKFVDTIYEQKSIRGS
jgi:thymidylate kinase